MRLNRRERLAVSIYELRQDRNRHFELAQDAIMQGEKDLAEKYRTSAEKETFELELLEREYRNLNR